MSEHVDVLRIATTPSCWVRNYPTSQALSDFISDRLNDGDLPEVINDYEIRLAGAVLWCENYPYAYGMCGLAKGFMPSRSVVFRLRDAELKVRGNLEDQIRAALARVTPERKP